MAVPSVTSDSMGGGGGGGEKDAISLTKVLIPIVGYIKNKKKMKENINCYKN